VEGEPLAAKISPAAAAFFLAWVSEMARSPSS